MHKFLISIGFPDDTPKKPLLKTLQKYLEDKFTSEYVALGTEGYNGEKWAEIKVYYGDNFGILWTGYFSNDKEFEISHFIPFLDGSVTLKEEIPSIERKKDDYCFMAVCDDIRIGVSLIFQVQNSMEWAARALMDDIPKPVNISFSALALNGSILLPILKPNTTEKARDDERQNRVELISAARRGDEKAIETLTIEDMDTYSQLSQRIMFEDILSIVDSSFMPYGLECDLYTVVADIISVKKTKNEFTKCEVYCMLLSCNDFKFDLIINAEDLLGEPLPGRRFKGLIWLQGTIK